VKYRLRIRGGYGDQPDGSISEWDLPLEELEIGDDFTLPAPDNPNKKWQMRVITILDDDSGEFREVIVDSKG
jgi:hypothetical protein